MKVSTVGALVDCNENIWIPILNTNNLIVGNENSLFNNAGSIFSEKEKYKSKSIFKVLENNNEVILFSKEKYELWTVNKNDYCVNHFVYWQEPMKGITDIVQNGQNAVVLTCFEEGQTLIVSLKDYTMEKMEINQIKNRLGMGFIRGMANNSYVYTATRCLDDISICRIDIDNKKASIKSIDVRMINAMNLYENNWYVFVLNKNNQTVLRKYDFEFNAVLEEYLLDDLREIEESGIIRYFRIEISNDKVIFIPSLENRIYIYYLNERRGRFLDYPAEIEKEYKEGDCTFLETQRFKDYLYFFPHRFNYVLKMDTNDEKIKPIQIIFNDSKDSVVKDSICLSDMLLEGDPITLEEFLKGL